MDAETAQDARPVLNAPKAARDVDALVAAALSRPVLQGEILDFLRELLADPDEGRRHKAAAALLRFGRPSDVELVGDDLPPLRALIREDFERVSVTGREEAYAHVLRPIEESLVDAYRWNRALTFGDARRAVARVLEFLPDPPDEPLARVIHGRLHRAAARMPGRVSIMELAACLKRVLVAIKAREERYLPELDDLLP